MLVPIATVWAGSLSLGGIWLMMVGPRRLPSLTLACWMGGLAAIAAGQFIFEALVADRLFPSASKKLSLTAEFSSFLAFVFGLGAMVVFLLINQGAM